MMRTKKFSPMDRDASPMVGGGILERKIIQARNGTAGWLSWHEWHELYLCIYTK